jgi:hypothetical protein
LIKRGRFLRNFLPIKAEDGNHPNFMKKTLVLFCFFFLGCATIFPDVRISRLIRNGNIYVGMSQEEFRTIMREPRYGKIIMTTAPRRPEVWSYTGEDALNLWKSYRFRFDENGILTGWDTSYDYP